MTVMTVTFFNASGIDFRNFLNAHLRSKMLFPNYVTFTAMTSESFSFYYDIHQLAAGSFNCLLITSIAAAPFSPNNKDDADYDL
jgi:hypothetical protein